MELRVVGHSSLNGTFTAPDGRTFALSSFASGAQEIVRFTPTQPGSWAYRLRDGNRTVAEGTVSVSAGAGRFVEAGGRGFVYDDGTPFIAVGENRINIYDPAWNWSSLSAPEYIRYMAEQGMSVLRVFIVSDIENEQSGGTNPGVLEPALGRFDEAVAAQFDAIFQSAQAHGVYVVLVAFALGFSQDDAWKSWQDNPYSKERGGPAATRYDFFESPTARAQAARRIRYLASRYSAYPSLLAVDLLNEPEWDGEIPEVSWTAWALELARVWDEADPYDHLVTVGSVGLHWNIEGDERAWWHSEECDIVQWHLYGSEFYDVHALAAEMTRRVSETSGYGKPVLIGEFAYGGEAKPEYDHTHVGLWSATFAGAAVLAHSAPPFNVDSDELMTPERARHFRVLRDFLTPLPALVRTRASASQGVGIWALQSDDRAAIWLLAPKDSYGTRVDGVTVSVSIAHTGTWRAQWIDDVTGAAIGASEVETRGPELQLRVPAFTKHVAARLERVEP
jgi:Cellulase (glycosyl hydrolase family 5)